MRSVRDLPPNARRLLGEKSRRIADRSAADFRDESCADSAPDCGGNPKRRCAALAPLRVVSVCLRQSRNANAIAAENDDGTTGHIVGHALRLRSHSGEIDVVRQTLLTRVGHQLVHRGDLRLARTAPDKDDNARVLAFWLESKNIIAIARDEYGPVCTRPLPSVGIDRRRRQYFAQACHRVSAVTQPVRQVVGNILIQEERHAFGSCICSATRSSISARWSS